MEGENMMDSTVKGLSNWASHDGVKDCDLDRGK